MWLMVWLLKTSTPSRPDAHTRNSRISTYLRCAICAAVAFCGPPIWDPTVKTSSSDIVPSFVSCWSATRFAIFAEVGCSRKATRLFDQCLQGSNINSEQVCCSQCYLKRDSKAQKGRDCGERERQPASGRGAWSSSLLCCSSCVDHFQNFLFLFLV